MQNQNENDITVSPDDESENIVISEKTKKLREDLKQCATEKKEYLDGWQRAKADFINYKKDERARMEDMARFIAAEFIHDILPVLDSFEFALRDNRQPTTDNQQHDERGILLVRLQLLDILKKRGLEEITVSMGDPFNPEMHESVGEIESEVMHGAIAEEVQKGYRLRGKVIRPVRVRLAK